jgi:tRNA1Val (adenine37-N6)-methyltransferase
MSHNKYFQFKQFRIEQRHAAMRVNTDGVLIGAWTNIEKVDAVLDIGTGTGLIALMIAQRCNAIITGIEIDRHTADEAAQNVRNSPWPLRISIQNISFQNFAEVHSQKFNLVITNPPFFSNAVKNTNQRISMARHNHSLPFTDLISGTLGLLDEKGRLSIILPVMEAEEFIRLASKNGLFLNRIAHVKPFPDKEPNRCLMEFSCIPKEPDETVFSVYDKSRSCYSDEFAGLARDFYQKL